MNIAPALAAPSTSRLTSLHLQWKDAFGPAGAPMQHLLVDLDAGTIASGRAVQRTQDPDSVADAKAWTLIRTGPGAPPWRAAFEAALDDAREGIRQLPTNSHLALQATIQRWCRPTARGGDDPLLAQAEGTFVLEARFAGQDAPVRFQGDLARPGGTLDALLGASRALAIDIAEHGEEQKYATPVPDYG